MQLTNAEQIAEKIEAVMLEARSKGVNVLALVHASHQGGLYYAGDKQQLVNLVKPALQDLSDGQGLEQDGVGSISYGL